MVKRKVIERKSIKRKAAKRVTFKVVVEGNKNFDGNMAGFVFSSSGRLVAREVVRNNRLSIPVKADKFSRYRLFIAPLSDGSDEQTPSLKMMERLNAYEPLVVSKKHLLDKIMIPGHIIDSWHFCLCWIRGQVVKDDTSGAVCGAKVHICEVDKFWRWIIRLPERDVFRLRDDLIREWQRPPVRIPVKPDFPHLPPPFEGFNEGTSFPGISVKMSAGNYLTNGNKLTASNNSTISNRQSLLSLRSQIPLKNIVSNEKLGYGQSMIKLPALKSASVHLVRDALVANLELIIPYLCLWPLWWRYRCDEFAVVETNTQGRFQGLVDFQCSGDQPDLYFWVEYEINNHLETVYRPPVPCATYWNYSCGSEVVIRLKDDRVQECGAARDLDGMNVWIETIGNNQSVADIHPPGSASAGLTANGSPFGGQLEPRVSFSRSNLISAGISHYLWSVKPVAAPDTDWRPLGDDVVRHYKHASGAVPVFPLGPEDSGSNVGRFRIQPVLPPTGASDDWVVWNQHVDLASAYLRTSSPAADSSAACGVADPDAGKYELKLELFKANGDRVNWTAEGIIPQITEPGPVDSSGDIQRVTAPEAYLIKSGSQIMAFKMVLHIDNSRCGGAILPIKNGVGLTSEECGFIRYVGDAQARIAFMAAHPDNFALVTYRVDRGENGCRVNEASVSRQRPGGPNIPARDTGGEFSKSSGCEYQRLIAVSTLLTSIAAEQASACQPCDERAAFSEVLWVRATATNGYSRLDYLDAFDTAAFALTKPCPPSVVVSRKKNRS